MSELDDFQAFVDGAEDELDKFVEFNHCHDDNGRFCSSSAEGASPDWDIHDGGNAPRPRKFESEEGYLWHEQGPGAEWVKTISREDQDVLGSYASFGYSAINSRLRGEPLMTEESRYADDKEMRAIIDKQPLPEATQAAGWERSSFMQVTRKVPDYKQRQYADRHAQMIDDVIRDRGLVLTEPIEVQRGAYFPGLDFDTLKAAVGTVREEPAFSSTMLGPAGRRAESYPTIARSESAYKRTGKAELAEVGTAVHFSIILPAGTKVASIEAARRYDRRKDDYNLLNGRRVTGDLGREQREAQRSESEILLGSGARFRILSVKPGPGYQSSVPRVRRGADARVTMVYIGGGSSEGKW